MIIVNNLLDVNKHIDDCDVVIFDLDDTLYSEKEYVKSGFHAIAECYKNINNLENRLWNKFISGKQAFNEIVKEESVPNELNNFVNIYRNHFPNIHLYEEAKILLNNIKKKIGIITDGRVETQINKINALNIKVDKIIITDSFGGPKFRKPNPRAFIEMKNYFKCEYSKMVYIGDNVNKDFIAPQQLGMKSIYFKNKEGIYQ